jgi:hypothetical protein
MDRDVLSDATVVAASSSFVCVRLLTYESASEAEFLLDLFPGRTGALENTVFAILAPDGKTPLTRAGRSPDMALGFGGAARLAREMRKIADRHPPKAGAARESPRMPWLVDLRRALDVAACDMLPLAVVVAEDAKEREALEATLGPLAWSEEMRGRFEWVVATRAQVREVAKGVGTGPLVVLKPDAFGLRGEVLAQAAGPSAEALGAALEKALAKHDPGSKDAREHVHAGARAGVDWETEIPVTDPDTLRAPRPR